MENFQGVLGDGEFVSNRSQQSEYHFPQSLIATGLGHQKALKNIQSPTVISNLLYKNITMVIHRFDRGKKDIFTVIHTKGKMERNHLGTKRLVEKMSSAERVPKGKARAILALRSLNGHLLIFFICPVKTRQIDQLKRTQN